MAQEVVITYETLFELLQREKERADLQRLEPTFFNDVIDYIKDKKKILEAKSNSSFALEEKRKTERQLENIYKIIGVIRNFLNFISIFPILNLNKVNF